MNCKALSNQLSPAPRTISHRWPATLLLLALCLSMAAFTAQLQAQTITVTNKLANGYLGDPFPETCPSGYPVSNIPTGYHIERPHVVYNSTTSTWVLWAHYDSSDYSTAEALVATSATQCGPYTISGEFRPLGYESRDDFLFKDTTGTAYFITASNHYGGANDTMAIFRLSSDYLTVDATAGVTWVFDNAYREAPIVVKTGSTYFLLTSQAAGWFPSQGGYATSTSMLSGWSALANLGNPSTFGGQESDIRIIQGSSTTSYILTMDHLGGNISYDDGDLWLPLILNASAKTATLEWYTSYQVNLTTGALTLPQNTDLALSKTATASSVGTGSAATNAIDGNYATGWFASSSTWPAWWMVDLGATKSIGEVDTSWFMYKGSEAYYQYKIDYSTDGTNFTTIDRTANKFYGFTTDAVNFSARYIKIELVNAVLQNNPNNWYTPEIWEVKLLAPADSVVSVPNYSLETPVTSTYVYNPTGGSWTFTASSGSNGSGISANNSGFTSGNPPAPQGSQVAFIQGTGSITQSLSGFTTGKSYTITFSAAQRANAHNTIGQTFNVVVNGTAIASFAPPHGSNTYQDYTTTFTPTSTTNTIQFLGTNLNTGDNTIFIDNIRIGTPN